MSASRGHWWCWQCRREIPEADLATGMWGAYHRQEVVREDCATCAPRVVLHPVVHLAALPLAIPGGTGAEAPKGEQAWIAKTEQ